MSESHDVTKLSQEKAPIVSRTEATSQQLQTSTTSSTPPTIAITEQQARNLQHVLTIFPIMMFSYANNALLLIASLSFAQTLVAAEEPSHLRGLGSFATSLCATPKECGNGICVTTTIKEGIAFDICKKCSNQKGFLATGLDENGDLICENIDECAFPALNNCDSETQDCVDHDGGYTCNSKQFLNLEVDADILIGRADDNWLGHSVSSAGDINGDGINDLIVGSPAKVDLDGVASGAAYIMFGRADGSLPAAEELDGTSGFAVFGKRINDRLGESVSSAGDVNGDGFDDVIIGAPGVEVFNFDGTFESGAGEAYIIYGTNESFPDTISAWEIDGTNGCIIRGNFTYDDLGESVSYAGDVNADGIDDVIVGAPRANPSGAFNGGEAYVIFGSATLPSVLRINDLDGSNGFIIESETDRDYFGFSVSYAGDLNADGIADVIIGATNATNTDEVTTGAAYVVYGRDHTVSLFERSVKTANLNGLDDGFAIYGNDRSRMGFSVSYAGDMDGDGVDDVIIGAPRANVSPRFGSGDAYIVYGSPGGFVSPMNTLDFGITTIIGKEVIDGFGYSVKSAGDVNGDGFPDVVIGAPYGTDEYNAEAYVVYGSPDLKSVIEIDAFDLNGEVGRTVALLPEDFDGSNSFRISVSSAGDIDGDGFDDLITGLSDVDMIDDTKQGRVKIVHGFSTTNTGE